MIACPACGTEAPETAKFCAQCGSPLAAEPAGRREERKVVTCVFADLVGFTARAEQLDPEDVRAVLVPYHERLRSELERFGGTVEKFIGDAVMAVFGAPTAHEDDPERAVRAALAIRDAIVEEGELHVRVGVTTGEALVNVSARPEAGEGMAAGDVVNTAARLQSAAPVDGILVDGTTHRATSSVIDYEARPPVEAKGKAEPVAVWEPLQARARFGVDVRQHGAASLVGRQRELDALAGALERARREESCQLVTLVGVPGIGKSRLVYELFRRVDEDEELIVWRQGRSLPYGEGVSFWALGEMVKAQAGILEGDGPKPSAEKLRRAVHDLVPAGEARWVEDHLRSLLGLGRDGAGERREESFAAWRRFLEALAEGYPTVLVFEDLHWADAGLLDFVDHLVDWVGSVPLLVLATARPELLDRRPGWAGGKLNATTVALQPLGDDDAARLVAELLERAVLPAAQQRALLERAGGNPLYAEQFVRLFVEREGTGDLPLPETVQGIVAARLDALSAREKAALQDASVHGKVFWSGALDGDAAELRLLLHALERKDFVRRERRSTLEGEEEYAFRHILVRDVAYAQIPRRARAERHRRAAAWIERLGRPDEHAELLAHHYLAALDLLRASGTVPPEVAEPARWALKAAGERASGLNAFAAARGYFEAALELWPADDPDRGRVLLGYGQAIFDSEGRGENELEEARDLLAAAGEREDAAVAEVLRAELAWKRGDQALCFERLELAQELVANAPDGRAKTYVLSSVSRFLMLAGKSDEAVRVGTEALALAERLGLPDLQSHALNNIGPAKGLTGRNEEGIADLERSIAIATEHPSVEGLRAHINLGSTLGVQGNVRRAREVHERGLELAHRFGHRPNIDWLEAEVASDAFLLGDWERARVFGNRFVEASEAGGLHYQGIGRLSERSFIHLARGDAEAGRRDAGLALARARVARDPQVLGPALAQAVFVAAAEGRRAEGEALTAEILADQAFVIYATPGLGCWAFGELGRGDDLLAGLERTEAKLLWVEAATAFLRGDTVGAADVYERIGDLPGEALVRLHAARMLAAQGRRVEADEQLARSLAFWRSVGATRYVREAEALLRASA